MVNKLNLSLLIGNVALSVGLIYLLVQNRPVSVASAPEAPLATNPPVIVTNVQVEVVTNQFNWGQLESEDYRTYIARLRSIGCPEQTIHDILIADLDKLYSPKISSASGHRQNLQYWQSEEEELANDSDPREVARKMQEIDREKAAVIQELIGVDLVRERLRQKGIADYYERRLAFLPEEKQTEMRRILEKFDQQERAIRDKEVEDGEALTPQDKTLLQSLRAQRQTEITGILSPDERKQYELWMSPSANAVRHSLYGMAASEQDFQKIYSVRKQFDERWGQQDLTAMDPQTRQQFEASKNQMDAEVKTQLGEEKYREYKRGDDDDYHRLCATMTRLKLPRQKANEVYEMKEALIEARQQGLANQALTPEQRDNLLRTLSDETERAARQVFGEKGFNSYLHSGYAQWLKN